MWIVETMVTAFPIFLRSDQMTRQASEDAARKFVAHGAPARGRMAPVAGDRTYLANAAACLTAATATPDLKARALHEEECKLWLMLASHRRAIEAVMQRHLLESGPL